LNLQSELPQERFGSFSFLTSYETLWQVVWLVNMSEHRWSRG